jgi:hypothetical protein
MSDAVPLGDLYVVDLVIPFGEHAGFVDRSPILPDR